MTQEDIIASVEKMTVVELNTLVKAIEEKWGVSAAAVAVAGPAAAAAEEKTEFGVELTAMGDQKIAVIKVVKEALGLGLAEAKTLVESAPVMLKADVKKEDAEAWKTKIEAAGGKVTLK
jgi:large subunit ribosomal protein L7/L12